jgi:hypothetical protein
MIHVLRSFERVPKGLVEEYKKLSSATIYEASGAKGALSSRLKPISPDSQRTSSDFLIDFRSGWNRS